MRPLAAVDAAAARWPFGGLATGASAFTEASISGGGINRATKAVRCSHAAVGQIRRALIEPARDRAQGDIQF